MVRQQIDTKLEIGNGDSFDSALDKLNAMLAELYSTAGVTGLDGSVVYTADITVFTGSVSVGESASALAIVNGSTIPTSGVGETRVAPAAARTGIILQPGTKPGQIVMVVNESAALNLVTFAASATSNVANGGSSVIAGLTARCYVWNSITELWYECT